MAANWMDHMGRLLLEGPPASDGSGAAANPLPARRPRTSRAPPCATQHPASPASLGGFTTARGRRRAAGRRDVPAFSAELTCQSEPGVCVRTKLRNPFSHELLWRSASCRPSTRSQRATSAGVMPHVADCVAWPQATARRPTRAPRLGDVSLASGQLLLLEASRSSQHGLERRNEPDLLAQVPSHSRPKMARLYRPAVPED